MNIFSAPAQVLRGNCLYRNTVNDSCFGLRIAFRFRSCGFTLVATVLALVAALPQRVSAQSVPAERPRTRPASALTGWADWEKGEEMLKRLNVPPAPVRTAEEELKTFKLASGYRIELVAAEPLVQNPIFFEFDPDGRIWVVEYQGYMRDLAGSGEGDPICRVVVLEDTDADGRADKSTVFLDKLVMPRSFAFVKGGVLLQEPPKLWFCEDTDGDLRCDKRTEVGTMGVAGNPQHTANGLRYGIDNWLHNADWSKRHRWSRDGKLIEEETIHRGQFGLTFDETGRFFTCYENKALHGDYLPAEYLLKNRSLLKVLQRGGGRSGFGVNVNIGAKAQEIFPIRVTPAITLGALELRDDGRLRTYTIASGVCCYDGHQFPPDARGNFFVPDSGGHLLGRLTTPPGIAPLASRYYPAEQEFLASTDERFRPVNARVGPDGALYVADMYHGIIEHVIFMVPWLAKQIQERHLDQGNDLGRIWRIVAENRPLDRRSPKLAQAASSVLVKTLAHPNGWHRLTAQRLLVERKDTTAMPLLRELAARGNSSTNSLGQLHALWTLEGLDALDLETRLSALDSADERIRAAAVRLCEREASPEALTALTERLADPSQSVRLQLALSLGTFRDAKATGLLAQLLARDDHALFRTASLTGLAGSELEFLTELLRDRRNNKTDTQNAFFLLTSSASEEHLRRLTTLLGQCVLEEAQATRVNALFDLFEATTPDRLWPRDALLEAFASVRNNRPFALAKEPTALTTLIHSPERGLRAAAEKALNQFTWPGAKLASWLTESGPPLTPQQEKRVAAGQELYAMTCAACHQPHGGGNAGVSPPLTGSDWVTGPPERLVRIVLHGLYGPIQVNDQEWNLSMPGFGESGIFDDEKLASVLSYVRRAWGNTGTPIEPALVAKVRKETAGRTLPWRAEELVHVVSKTDETPPIQPSANGDVVLPASRANVFAQRLAYRPALDLLGPWINKDDVAEWRVNVPKGGTYEVYVLLAADEVSAGNQFAVETEGSQTISTVQSSGGFDRFREFPAGKLTLHPGVNRLLMRPHGPLQSELADVRSLRLVPAR